MWAPVLQSFKKVSGFNDVLFPSFKRFKCVTQFITLFQKSRKNQNKIEPVESFICIIGCL